MDADEREVCIYLKSWRGQFVSVTEICRRAGGKRRYRQEPEWALPALTRLVERGILESDSAGHYCLKAPPPTEKKKQWVSPQIRKILESSGKPFDDVLKSDDEDDFLKD